MDGGGVVTKSLPGVSALVTTAVEVGVAFCAGGGALAVDRTKKMAPAPTATSKTAAVPSAIAIVEPYPLDRGPEGKGAEAMGVGAWG
jgi:hypothetical protein